MLEPGMLVFVASTFLIAGAIKGLVGLGLPTVSLALLTVTVGLQPAMALLLAPSFATNAWQAFAGGDARALAARLWPFLLTAMPAVWVGVLVLGAADVRLLSAMLGVLTVVYALIGLRRPRLSFPRRGERWASPLLGTTNGLLTGMTGSFVLPGVPYFQALGMRRDTFIQAIGMLALASTVALGLSLGGQRFLTADHAMASAIATVPAVAGMGLGQLLRRRIPEERFRRVFLLALLGLGAAIVVRSAP